MQPTGFSPREVSSLHNRRVVEEHADEAASLWQLRRQATCAPLYRLRHLEQLDQRVLAHLEGLRVAGPHGFVAARSRLADADAGTAFVTTYLALAASDQPALHALLKIGLAEESVMDGVFAAFAWTEAGGTRGPLTTLALSAHPRYQSLALRVEAAHHATDLSAPAAKAARSPSPELRATAFRAIGESKRFALRVVLADAQRDGDDTCRFWAAWSLALMGERQAAPLALECAIDKPRLERRAIDFAMRAGEPAWARETLRKLAADGSTLRQAVIAAGAFGDPKVVPWLLHLLDQPSLARVAAEAFSMITGADLDESSLKQDAPEDAGDGHEDDRDLRWPSPDGMRSWWSIHQGRFSAGTRHIAGWPVSRASAVRVLHDGYQRQRGAAALELALLDEQATVFSCAARGDWQRMRLAA